ncbi:MAG: hypothetical protein V4476_19605 [Pseudomonadota bacterium]
MKYLAQELAAVAAANYPALNARELETKAFLAEMDALSAAIAAVPREERMERGAAALAACATLADVEAVRAHYWMLAPLPARMVAVMSAGMDKKRAHDNLNTFDALQRGRVWVELKKLILNLTAIQRCMVGGKMPAGRAPGVMDHEAGLADTAKNWTAH